LLRLNDGDVAGSDAHEHNGAGVGETGVVVEIVVFTIVSGRRLLGLGEEEDVAGLEFGGEFRATGSEFLWTAEIIHGGAVRVLRGCQKSSHEDEEKERNSGASNHGVTQCSP